jgi:hypothetical protein
MLETGRLDTFLSPPSTQHELRVLHPVLKSVVILVTLTLKLFLFPYFKQSNHESGISVVWDVTLCRGVIPDVSKEHSSIIFNEQAVQKTECLTIAREGITFRRNFGSLT